MGGPGAEDLAAGKFYRGSGGECPSVLARETRRRGAAWTSGHVAHVHEPCLIPMLLPTSPQTLHPTCVIIPSYTVMKWSSGACMVSLTLSCTRSACGTGRRRAGFHGWARSREGGGEGSQPPPNGCGRAHHHPHPFVRVLDPPSGGSRPAVPAAPRSATPAWVRAGLQSAPA